MSDFTPVGRVREMKGRGFEAPVRMIRPKRLFEDGSSEEAVVKKSVVLGTGWVLVASKSNGDGLAAEIFTKDGSLRDKAKSFVLSMVQENGMKASVWLRMKEVEWTCSGLRRQSCFQELSVSKDRRLTLDATGVDNVVLSTFTRKGSQWDRKKLRIPFGRDLELAQLMAALLSIDEFWRADQDMLDVAYGLGLLQVREPEAAPADAVDRVVKALKADGLFMTTYSEFGRRLADSNPAKAFVDMMLPLADLLSVVVPSTVISLDD